MFLTYFQLQNHCFKTLFGVQMVSDSTVRPFHILTVVGHRGRSNGDTFAAGDYDVCWSSKPTTVWWLNDYSVAAGRLVVREPSTLRPEGSSRI